MTQTDPSGVTHPSPPSEGSPWRALSILLVGVFMAVLDTFIVLVAAPAIQADLGATGAELQLVFAGYQLTYAVALITCARLGDLLGRKPMFLGGMLLFTLSSAACAAAPDAGLLIAARFVQGLAAAAMFPQVLAMIHVVVPEVQRPKAFSVLGAVIGMSGIVGQLLGGVLVGANLFGSSWRPIFWVNVPIGLITIGLALAFVPRSRPAEARRLDLPGAAVLTVALCLLVVPLIVGREAGWPLWTWFSLFGSVLAFGVFGFVERQIAQGGGVPLIRLRMFRQRPFAVGMTLVLLTYAGINSFFLVLSLTAQDGLGMNALEAGLIYLPFAAAFFAASFLGGRLSEKGKNVLLAGAVLGGCGNACTIAVVLLLGDGLTGWWLAPPLILVGAGNGLFVPPLLNAVLSRIPHAEAGMASGVLSTGQQVGGALGVAVLGAVYYGALGAPAGSYGYAFALAVAVNLVLAIAISLLLPSLSKRA
ncbi:MFS transporter [Saccharopolyspora sp. NPDC050642]|uniref:MFS transporter n=1 Tax=Saccharopolyspora sp. NPDC050642 TaxID=3157099 RepID=UPI0033FF6EA4